jgi:formylglycine-generating enzyme required for sulfatase activity
MIRHKVLVARAPSNTVVCDLEDSREWRIGSSGVFATRLAEGPHLLKLTTAEGTELVRLVMMPGSRRPVLLDYRALLYSGNHAPKVLDEAAPRRETKPSGERQTNTVPEMVFVPAGEFVRGVRRGEGVAAAWGTRRRAVAAFAIGKYEVTSDEFATFVRDTDYVTDAERGGGGMSSNGLGTWGWHAEACWRAPFFGDPTAAEPSRIRERLPVVMVSWNDANAYTRWLSERTGRTFRLPREDEWEWAARGDDGRMWPWGDRWNGDFSEVCNHGLPRGAMRSAGTGDSSDGYLLRSPVEAFPAGVSSFGVFDMVGNVKEWVLDDFVGRSPHPLIGTRHAGAIVGSESFGGHELTGVFKALRGSGWYSDPMGAFLNAVSRNGHVQSARFAGVGFRVVEELHTQK